MNGLVLMNLSSLFMRWVFFIVAVALHRAQASTADDAIAIENEQLRSRLKALESRLDEERQFSYVRASGYLGGAATIYEETMEVAEAKQWCNANPECKGFTFLAPLEGDDEQEVTVTFKGTPESKALQVISDPSMASYIKAAAAESIFGNIGDAAMQLTSADHQSVVSQWLTFQVACILLAGGVGCVWICRQRLCGGRGRTAQQPVLPQSNM